MRELLIATNNQKKLKELKELLSDLPLRITSLKDYKNMPKIEEDGKTFSQNALKKASTISIYTKKLVMGEDSGLEVKALNNCPGVFSARFSGANATDKKNNLKLLRSLNKVPLKERQARYRCCVALTDQNGIVGVVSGSCSGIISLRSKGRNGFGYDPLFLISRYRKTFGELDPCIKSKISHRARALKKFKFIIKKYLESHPE
ncbi:MAG: RdgB/HAM1 family non-canonical purine NTP pyrophosphatase [Candidatus Omnitrophica bacterium]|nr:RdgB/HAM1 family non-canonical purine NTP pyrophosphatase [Candidatus Omnitrophota bacterium]